MIHHAIFGSIGRFVGLLLEQHEGRLPFWLSPEQVAVLPVSEAYAAYAAEVSVRFEEAGLRAVSLDGAETLARRIVTAREMEVPVIAVVGAREAENGSVTLRERDGGRQSLALPEAAERLSQRRHSFACGD